MKATSLVLVLLAVIALTATALALFEWRTRPAKPGPPITIQDGRTIDFSSGRAVVKDSAAEQAIIAAAVKEIDAAAHDVTFTPAAPPKAAASAPSTP